MERMENGEIEVLSEQHNGMLQQLSQSPRHQRQQRQHGRQQGGRNGRKQQSTNLRKPRPHCTNDRCEKPVGQWESTCLRKARDTSGRHPRLSGCSKRDRSSSRVNLRHRSRRNDRDNDGNDDRRSQASKGTGDDNRRGQVAVALTAVGTHLAINTVGKVSAKRKLSAVAAGTKPGVPSVFVNGGE